MSDSGSIDSIGLDTASVAISSPFRSQMSDEKDQKI